MEGKESVTTVGEGGGGVVNWKPSSSSSSSSRPRLSLPPRPSSIEEQALFMKQSPGPMTMFLSSLLSDYVDPDAYPESECRSFSQLLAGAMSSPNAHPTTPSAMMMMKMYSPSEAALGAQNNSFHEGGVGGLGNGNGDGNGNGRELRGFKSSTPISIPIPMSPFFTVPPGFSPTTLLDSPGFLSGGQGPFGISHQQVLAQVQAQAQSQVLPQMQVQASSYPSSMSSTSTAMMPLQMEYTAGADGNAYGVSCQQKMPAQPESNKTIGCPELASQATEPNQRSLPHIYPVAERPSDDGYKWRKYGQKQVKGSEYPRSYYKCTHPKCPVKKKVERSHDGQVTEIIYKGDHNHNRKTQSSRPIANAAQQYLSDQDGRYAARGSDDKNENLDGKIDGSIQLFSGDPRGRSGINTNVSDPSTSAREHDVGQRSAEHSSDSSDDGEDDDQASRADIADDDDNKSETKRRKKEKSIKEIEALLRTSKEPRVVVQTTSDIDILDDGYRWRKYGQKVVKGNPHPRSYYKCTNVGCSVRKHVERASNDIKAVITTYEGKHNHDVPAARNSSHDTAGSGSQFHAGNNPITSSSLPKPSTISLLEQQAGNCPSSSGWTLQSRTQGQDMNSQGVKEGSLSAVNITQNYVGNMENFTSTAASNIASNQINMERPFPNDYTFTFSGAALSRTVTPKEEQDTISVATGF